MGTLNEKEIAILKATAACGVMTPLLAHLLIYSDLTFDAARKAVERLNWKGWLREYDLPDKTHYYVLSFRAAGMLKLHRVHARAPGYTKLVRRLAIAYHCARHGGERMSPAQFRRLYPGCSAKGVREGQYFRQGEFLCFAHVDPGQSPKALRERVVGIVRQRNGVPALRQRIVEQTFRVVVLTTTEEKRWLAERAVRTLPCGHLASAAVVPELLGLVEGVKP